ncbi:prepilin-type N-terminal cleavage/methylation domain-containing protein [bacterium]|nr:prepilin-type N-terminal cleavage/methylation domain-containing protein [bacterium]
MNNQYIYCLTRRMRGYSLTEIMIVIAIITVLAALILPNLVHLNKEGITNLIVNHD